MEVAIDTLPEIYRSIFVLREVQGLSTAETADGLELSLKTVKTRLLRARGLLRKLFFARAGIVTADAFSFHLSRCDRVVAGVFARRRLPALH